MQEYSDSYNKRPLWQWIGIYVVVGGLLYGLIYYFVMKKNGSYTTGGTNNTMYAVPTSSSMNGAPTSGATNKVKLTLLGENKSGESGTAVLEEINGKVSVTVSLTGFVAGVVQPAHIHIGACPGVGAVKYPLKSLVNGTSVTTLDVTMAQLKTELPLALNVHKSASEVSVYTACGPLSF
jgi:hypothetical protein